LFILKPDYLLYENFRIFPENQDHIWKQSQAGQLTVSLSYNATMKTAQPDIVVISPDGEYLMIVEVKLKDVEEQNAIKQLRRYMASIGCSVGLVVSGEHITLLRDSFEKSGGESIDVVGEARLPDSLLPPADKQWQEERALEFESRVQRWLEKLKLTSSMENLPDDLRKLFGEPIISLLRLGEVRAAGPRWSKAAK
jgi:Type I restriction enzyme R protein N terminus (HSDR_N)